ncbi:MAG: PKD domain-containing protein [Anaerolineaceae bacterium]|nr:PKD domain-containing protein [Anaerolineaceae bacterium]
MKKAILVVSLFLVLTSTVYFSGSQLKAAPPAPQVATPIDSIYPGLGIITSRTARDGRLATSNQAILGPGSCTHMGDPYSPFDSPWAPGPYTYTYRIYVPPTYAYDIVRVELFDPDSMNIATNSVTINRTNTAINNGLSAVASKTCGLDGGNSSRVQPCLLRTDELNLVNGAPNLDLDQINPFWFVRIDENRIRNLATCTSPASYTTSANTQTRYSLSYFAQNPDETLVKIPLVDYFGQTGDGIRDTGDHLTDMRWVSPGADVPFSTVDDPGASVPATARTIDSFEIDLTTDVPNIFVDPATGGRYLYLDVQTMSGTSENGYEVWAGPPTYVNTIPSEVNARNLYLLNHAGAHDAAGVEITAVNTLVQNSNYTNPLGIPLAYVGPELAGQTINVRLFDTDSGAQPPIIFYFDSIAFTPADTSLGYDPGQTDWAMAFAVTGQDDADGVAEDVRCKPGGCPTQWVEPAYQITVPGDLSSCDWQNPTAEACTPFYGGRLMAYYDGGFSDTYAWELSVPLSSDPVDPTLGCSAFPITIHEGARSVTAPGTGSNPYPNLADFTYPTSPPVYTSFLDHQDDVPLLDATPGDIYRVQNGFGNGNFGWLAWNINVANSANALENSLQWPGNSTNYNACTGGSGCPPGQGVPGSGFSFNVPGYIEPGDPTDHALHLGDWIVGSTGSLNSLSVQEQLKSHIDLERTLRLPIWNNHSGTGLSGPYQTTQFAIFRLLGYNTTSNWLLLEFVSFDTSCGQLASTPSSVSLAGPTEGETEISYTFTATVSPNHTSTPITYTWDITDHGTITSTGGISDTVTLNWSSAGDKVVTVTAVNSTGSTVSQSHAIHISPPDVAADSVAITGPTSGAANTSYDFTAAVNPLTTTTPVTYTWEITGYDTITNTGGLTNTISLSWASAGSKSVVVTAVNSTGFTVTQNHTIDIALPEYKVYLPLVIKN